MKYHHISLGGTFDHLHSGHKHFLKSAYEESEFVTVGITTDEFLKSKNHSGKIESFNIRKEAVEAFLLENNFCNYEIIPLDDIYGNTLLVDNLDAIFVTEESIENAKLINKKRQEKGFPLLEIVKVTLIKSEDGQVISSTRIRLGEIDREGELYIRIFDNVAKLLLPQNMREELKKPFGKVIGDQNYLKPDVNDFVIAVGDITVVTFLKNRITPNLSIFDYKTQREDIDDAIKQQLPSPTVKLYNNSGVIESTTVKKIEKIIKECIVTGKKAAVKITGEEDLLSLPVIMLAPLASKVYYGLKDEGMVEIEITEDVKKEISKKYLEKFIR